MTASRARVFLVEDHDLTLAGSRIYLDEHVEIVGAADNVTDAVAMIREREPDLVLLDLRIREGHGADVVREVRTTNPEVRFLVLTVSTSRDDVRRMFDVGVDGYLTKNLVGAELPALVAEALAGLRPISNHVAGHLLDIDGDVAAPGGIEQLTPREREVVLLIARGFTYKETAAQLGISVKTLENHMCHIFRKLGVASRYELAALAFETNFAGPAD